MVITMRKIKEIIENTIVIDKSKFITTIYPVETIEEINNGLEELKKMNYFIERVYYTYDQLASESAIKVSRKILLKYINEGKVKLMSYNKLLEDTNYSENEIKEELVNEVIDIIAEILNIDKSIYNNVVTEILK